MQKLDLSIGDSGEIPGGPNVARDFSAGLHRYCQLHLVFCCGPNEGFYSPAEP
jgi:hypothetical protein